jgi:hypothetical protein
VHGLSDAVGILGPLPDHWEAIIKPDASGISRQRFIHFGDNAETLDDPRLDALPREWERGTYGRLAGDPAIFETFKNRVTGEVVNYDPRLSLEALDARGIKLQAFRLV